MPILTGEILITENKEFILVSRDPDVLLIMSIEPQTEPVDTWAPIDAGAEEEVWQPNG